MNHHTTRAHHEELYALPLAIPAVVWVLRIIAGKIRRGTK